jgi:UDP-N-acetylglucosamine:LPS N-acetylglucosamine transferase
MGADSRRAVLFFSRGRGRGHAIPDIAIAAELPEAIDVRFVSYATGAETLKQAGLPLVDLGLGEENDFFQTMIAAAQVISSARPEVVVSHEEFSALPAAALAGVPAIFVNEWLPAPGSVAADCLAYAASIVLIGFPGVFPVPPSVRAKPVCIGPMVRKMKYTLSDRSRARKELGLADDATVLSVIPGAWTEERAPILDLVVPAFEGLKTDHGKLLVWVARTDHDRVRKAAEGRDGVTVTDETPVIERLMVASDVVITKGNRVTILESASLGVPSISLSYGLNPVDDTIVARIPSNTALHAKAVDSQFLSGIIAELAFTPLSSRERPLNLHIRGGEAAAQVLAAEIERLTGSAASRPEAALR